MSYSSPVTVPRDLRTRYSMARSVQDWYTFYYDYFSAILPAGLDPVAMPDLSSGQRKELRLVTWRGNKVLMSGLVHRRPDYRAEEVAGDEAYTRVSDTEGWEVFLFFTAAEEISFYAGLMEEGNWVLQARWHPIYDAQKVHEYLKTRLEEIDADCY